MRQGTNGFSLREVVGRGGGGAGNNTEEVSGF